MSERTQRLNLSPELFGRRVAYGAWVDGAGDEGQPAFFLAETLTDDGVRLRTPRPLPAGARHGLQLLVENEARIFATEAEVDDGDDGSSTLRFVDLDDDGRQFLRELIAEATTFDA
jgi:hypothetical protein